MVGSDGGVAGAAVQRIGFFGFAGALIAAVLLVSIMMPAYSAEHDNAATVDSMAWRVKACSACHGDQGRASAEGYFPRLAGKPAGYLFQQLLNFRDGRRSHAQMAYLLAHLTDDYLREMADYFALRQVPYPPPLRPQAATQVLAVGEALVLRGDAARGLPACIACHGSALTGVLPVVPGLLGLSRDYLNSQLGAWQSGQRHAQAPDCMADIARKLSAQEVAAISAWLSAQTVPDGGKPRAPGSGAPPLACAGMVQSPAAQQEGQ